MYQMGPKSPSVNGQVGVTPVGVIGGPGGAGGGGPSGKPPAVSDAQAREKLAVNYLKRFISTEINLFLLLGLRLRVSDPCGRKVSRPDFPVRDSLGEVDFNWRSARFLAFVVSKLS